jgi:hypothetical protein
MATIVLILLTCKMLGELTPHVLTSALVYGYAYFTGARGQMAIAFAAVPGVASYFAGQVVSMAWLAPVFSTLSFIKPEALVTGAATLVVGVGMGSGVKGIPQSIMSNPVGALTLFAVGAGASILADYLSDMLNGGAAAAAPAS